MRKGVLEPPVANMSLQVVRGLHCGMEDMVRTVDLEWEGVLLVSPG